MKNDVILLPGNDGEGLVAAALVNEVKEAIVFLAARLGCKNMMIVDSNTEQLLAGEEVYREKLARGDTDTEVILCDPNSPAIQQLAEINRSNLVNCHRIQKEYCYVDPNELIRDEEHAEHFKYDRSGEFEGTMESYAKYDRMNPVYYVEFWDGDKVVKAVVDGEKYVQYARKEKMEKVFACRLIVANNDDLLTVMFQLQRGNHESCMALFRMIQALWPKFFKGSGYRSDLDESELDNATGPDGKKLDIYAKIGLQLNLSGNRVKQLRKIGLVNPLHFERIEQGRFTFFQAYQACIKEERGELPPVPSVKAPTYHTSSTPVPQFTKPDTTAGDVVVEYAEAETDTGTSEEACTNHDEVPVGKVVAVTDDYIVVQGKCQHCGKQTLLRIYKQEKNEN